MPFFALPRTDGIRMRDGDAVGGAGASQLRAAALSCLTVGGRTSSARSGRCRDSLMTAQDWCGTGGLQVLQGLAASPDHALPDPCRDPCRVPGEERSKIYEGSPFGLLRSSNGSPS